MKPKLENNKPARIGIDARFYGPLGKGLGRYTQEIVDNVVALDSSNEYIIFLSRENFDEFIPSSPRVSKVLADVRWYTLAEQFVMPRLIKEAGVDLMHFPHFNVPVRCPVPFVVTIHDLILTKFPTQRATTLGPIIYFLKNLGYRFVISRAVKRAERVIGVSQFTKDDIIKQFSLAPEKVAMIYEGVAHLRRETDSRFTAKLNPSEVLSGYCILEPYLLYVGNAYPHKNLEMLIRVFKKLHQSYPDLKLVLVGREDYFYSRLKAYAEQERLHDGENGPVIFPGYVPDRDLETFFQHAAVYVFPSKYEGFGLPPLEAMAEDCPVASSKESCLPEILGEAAVYFDPYDEASMAKTITDIFENPDLRNRLIEKGRKQVTLYDWKEAARQTLALYEEILNMPS